MHYDPTPALTVRQPWATLIAIGAKQVETRTWRPRQVPFRLAIHAAKAHPEDDWPASLRLPWAMWVDETDDRVLQHYGPEPFDFANYRSWPMPLGAVVATVDVVDVVPIRDADTDLRSPIRGPKIVVDRERLWMYGPSSISPDFDLSDQLPFGDWSHGRWAWLLLNPKPVDPPAPATGRQGLWWWDGRR